MQVSTDDRVQVHDRSLSIRSLSPADNGVYSCSVENRAGYTDNGRNYPLILHTAQTPNLLTLPQDVAVNKTGTAQFDCVFENATRLDWFARDESVLRNSTKRTVFPNGTLWISKVKPGDEGAYKCVGVAGMVDGKNGMDQAYVAQLRIASEFFLLQGFPYSFCHYNSSFFY